MSQFPLRPSVYSFYDAEGRCTYVGKALRNPGDRIKAHFDERKPHALTAAWIELQWFPHGTSDYQLRQWEEWRIKTARTPGNQVHNRAHYDARWAHKVSVEARRGAGQRVGVRDLVTGVRLWVVGLVRRSMRAGGWMIAGGVVAEVLRNAA